MNRIKTGFLFWKTGFLISNQRVKVKAKGDGLVAASWVFPALFTALFESGKDVFGKASLKDYDPLVVAWLWRLLALPFLVPVLFWTGFPAWSPTMLGALMVSGVINVLTSLMYMQALRLGDISLTVPMVSFTPMFLLVTSPLILNETIGQKGIFGVMLVVAGSLLLHRSPGRWNWKGGILAIFRHRGARTMLAVAFLWSISANIDKVGVQASNPYVWALVVNAWVALMLTPWGWRRWRKNPAPKGRNGALWAVGACGGLTSLCQMMAISLGPVPYVIAMKRTSTLFSVIWGCWLFKEQGFKSRLVGAVVMLTGAIILMIG